MSKIFALLSTPYKIVSIAFIIIPLAYYLFSILVILIMVLHHDNYSRVDIPLSICIHVTATQIILFNNGVMYKES